MLWQFLKPTLIVIAVVLLIRTFGLEPYHILPPGHMTPTLAAGDHVAVLKFFVQPRRGDIVLVRNPKNRLIRLIGLPGEKIELDTFGRVRVNNHILLAEPYATYHDTKPSEFNVPTGSYLVLADVRGYGNSSEAFIVPETNIKGRAWFLYSPANGLRRIQQATYDLPALVATEPQAGPVGSSNKAAAPDQPDFKHLSSLARLLYEAITYLSQWLHVTYHSSLQMLGVLAYCLFNIAAYRYRQCLQNYRHDCSHLMAMVKGDRAQFKQMYATHIYPQHAGTIGTGGLILVVQIFFLALLWIVLNGAKEFAQVPVISFAFTDPKWKFMDFSKPNVGLALMLGILTLIRYIWFLQTVPSISITSPSLTIGLAAARALLFTGLYCILPQGIVVYLVGYAWTAYAEGLVGEISTRIKLIFFYLACSLVLVVVVKFFPTPPSAPVVETAFEKAVPTPGKPLAESENRPERIQQTPGQKRHRELLKDAAADLRAKRFKEALQKCNEALKLEPKNKATIDLKAEILMQQAVVQLSKGQERYHAYTALEEAWKLNPASENCRAELAGLYLSVAEEELHDVVIRTGPSEFYSPVRTAHKGESFTAVGVESSNEPWLQVALDNAQRGWVSLGVADKISLSDGSERIRILGKRPKSDVYPLLVQAEKIGPALKWRIIWAKHSTDAIAIFIFTIMVGVIVVILWWNLRS